MPTSRPTTTKLKLDIYHESQESLRELAGQLDGQQLMSLAQEVLANVAQRDADLRAAVANPTSKQISDLCHALIADDDQAGADYILSVQANGASADVVYLKYLAEAARMLGVWWEDDQVSFVKVGLGTNRIFSIMRAMQDLFKVKGPPATKTALFATVPGEDHTVGIRMATDFFRRAGWSIDLKIGRSQEELLRKTDWTETYIVGLTYAGGHSIDALTRLLVAIKVHAPATEIFVGGQDVSEISDVTTKLGLAAASSDVEEALVRMNQLWDGLVAKQA